MLANNFLSVHNDVVFVILCVHVATCDRMSAAYYSSECHNATNLSSTSNIFINNKCCFNWNNDRGNVNMLQYIYVDQQFLACPQ